MSLDYSLFQFVNSFAGTNQLLDFLFVAITDFGVPALIMLTLFFCKKKPMYKTLFALWLVFVIDFVFKLFYFRPRPFASNQVNLLVDHLASASFPSRHTDLAFAIAASIFLNEKKLGVIALIIAFLVGFSRIFVGVHYPFDVFAGIVIGTAGAFFANWVIDEFWRD